MAGSIDDRITVWVATHRWPALDGPFVWLGTIEKLGAVWVVLALIVALVSARGAAGVIGAGLVAALTTFAADAASFGIKGLVHRPRPFAVHPQIHPLYVVHSSSFPAGHAATAFAGATVVSWLAPRMTPFFVALAVPIGLSRVYVGDHYVGDVLGGALVGVLVALVAIVLIRAAGGHRRLRARLPVERVRPVGGQVADR
jgi:undecaprenyl-diphosphatase